MKRALLALLALFLVIGAAALSGDNPPLGMLQITKEERNPWTHLRLNNDPDEFQFAIVSDRTGGHREKVFSQAVEKLNLLQPQFVVSVGDLIEGGKAAAPDKIESQWKEFQGFVGRLQMPFFYVPGNHDMGNAAADKLWQEKLGRRYYHFLYRNVLFLLLNTEDPPGVGAGHLSQEQIAYAKRVLEENRSARWTIVAMHKPVWTAPNVEKTGWLDVEKALAARPYTVFVGHKHIYKRYVRNDRLYYQLATTGGSSKMRGVPYGEFDHVVLVTMKKAGPVLANVLVEGVFPDNLKVIETTEPGTKRVLKAAQPAHGKVTFDGRPVPDAQVVFHPVNTKATLRPEAVTVDNGTFILTSYTRNDGVPVGEYKVTVVLVPGHAENSKGPAIKQLPERYGKPATTDLRATVNEGLNQFVFELKK